MPTLRRLKDKEARAILREFVQLYPKSETTLRSATTFDELIIGDGAAYFIDGKPLILRTKRSLLPTLKFEEVVKSLPRVVVDMGAVAHIANGAQLMSPGVRNLASDFAKGELLVIVDEKYGKPIALGIADMDSGAMRTMKKGKVVENVHYVGDEAWRSFATVV
ncbi:MAG TPA: PUA domain-containing protein [Terriglobales bacterium]|nr:PUA domain-containing protein [Terriglobales bacterium]